MSCIEATAAPLRPASPAEDNAETLPLLDPSEIRLLCWNIQKQRSPDIHAALRHFAGSTHLALLQEVWMESRLRECFTAPWEWEFSHGYRSLRRVTGVMTLAQSRAIRSSGLQRPEPWLRTAKATSVCHYGLTDREEDLLVVNIHAINFSLGTRAYRRQLQDVAPDILHHQGPVIFAGDLNAWSRERQSVLENFCAHLGLTEVHYDEDARPRILQRPLDFIFVKGLETADARVLQHPCSDHNPLEVTLSHSAS